MPRNLIVSVSDWWARHRTPALRCAVGVMALMATLKLGDELRRLLFDTGPDGAIDLRQSRTTVSLWFGGRDISRELRLRYPPGSMALFYLLGLGPFGEVATRWLWAASLLAVTCACAWLLVRESGAESTLEKQFVVIMLLSMNATGVNVGNGQTALHVLWLMTVAILMLDRYGHSWRTRLLAVAALTISLVKPSMSLPFLGLMFVRPRGAPVAAAAVGAYGVVTIIAGAFKDQPLLDLVRGSVAWGRFHAATGGYANIDSWLSAAGLFRWELPMSAIVLAAFGLWLVRYRRADLWILLGVTAIAARLWMYHRVYDDMLIVLAMLALFRIAKQADVSTETSMHAGVLLGIAVFAMLAPARLEHVPFPWHVPFTVGHAVLWIGIGAFLAAEARKSAARHQAGGKQRDGHERLVARARH